MYDMIDLTRMSRFDPIDSLVFVKRSQRGPNRLYQMQVSVNVLKIHAANIGCAKKEGYAVHYHEWHSDLEH